MKLPDSCVWIEAFKDSTTGRKYQAMLTRPADILVPAIVQFELRRWALRELGEVEADRIMVALQSARLVPIDESIALHAADLADAHKLHALDALVYATALAHTAELITCDAHFKGLPHVVYEPKKA